MFYNSFESYIENWFSKLPDIAIDRRYNEYLLTCHLSDLYSYYIKNSIPKNELCCQVTLFISTILHILCLLLYVIFTIVEIEEIKTKGTRKIIGSTYTYYKPHFSFHVSLTPRVISNGFINCLLPVTGCIPGMQPI